MKNRNFYKNCRTLCVSSLAMLALLFASCDLERQESFELQSEIPEIPVNQGTAYDYIQLDPNENLTQLAAAIDFLGMQDDFGQADQTYLLLKDGNRWDDNGDDGGRPRGVWKTVTGNNNATIADITGPGFEDERALLRKILLAHVLPERVDQLSLGEFKKQFVFQTMNPSSMIAIHREWGEWVMFINRNGGDQGRNAPDGSRDSRVERHNILFSNNSVAHEVNQMARWGASFE